MIDEGWEIGLHASYNAYNGSLRSEKILLEKYANIEIQGLRHHYWHISPTNAEETLILHNKSGFFYDSSLAFEKIIGFRRGIGLPFFPYSTKTREKIFFSLSSNIRS